MSEPAGPGVRRRRKADVPYSQRPISVARPARDKGRFVLDAVLDGFSEADARKKLAERLKSK